MHEFKNLESMVNVLKPYFYMNKKDGALPVGAVAYKSAWAQVMRLHKFGTMFHCCNLEPPCGFWARVREEIFYSSQERFVDVQLF